MRKSLATAAILSVAAAVLVVFVGLSILTGLYTCGLGSLTAGPALGKLWCWMFGDRVVSAIVGWDSPELARRAGRLVLA